MTNTTKQIIEVRAKLFLVSSMLARVADDLGDLSIDRSMTEEQRALFAQLSDDTCAWSHAIDKFNAAANELTK